MAVNQGAMSVNQGAMSGPLYLMSACVAEGALIADKRGTLYGTTIYGGSGGCSIGGFNGCGTVFKLPP
jgi:hypothetical protein